MRYLPVQLDVREREVAIVGTGAEALGKLARLRSAGARVTVYAPTEAPPGLDPAVMWVVGEPSLDELSSYFLIFVSTEELAVGEALAAAGHPLRCTLDRPALSTFANPAVVDVEPVVITIATDGRAPGLASHLRSAFERALATPAFSAFARALVTRRAELPLGSRAALTRQLLDGFSVAIQWRFPQWFEPEGPS